MKIQSAKRLANNNPMWKQILSFKAFYLEVHHIYNVLSSLLRELRGIYNTGQALIRSQETRKMVLDRGDVAVVLHTDLPRMNCLYMLKVW